MKRKVTFKRDEKLTGRASIGYPHRGSTIKVNGDDIGNIEAPNWKTKDNLFSVCIHVKNDKPGNCPWKRIVFAKKFESDPEAREWIKSVIDQIYEKYEIYPFTDD